MNEEGAGPGGTGLRSPSVLSLFLVTGVYFAASTLLREPDAYRRLAFLLPPDWWGEVAGKGGVLVLLWLVISWRLRCESRGWDAAGWNAFSGKNAGRELAWALGCAALVIVAGESFLNRGPGPSNWAAAEKWDRNMASAGAGKYVVFVLGTILTGINEELFYRGGFFAFLRGRGCRGLAVFLAASSVVFATFHGLSSAADYAIYAAMGAVFAVTLAVSGSLRSVILAHILVNGFHGIAAICEDWR
ncbi:MAG: CPBP family intramembrane metalloprotease [Elusimicrobia bacterium]|nr:CPBP family intramembrane metalloprotease [Elusimicrobiota bacterium]